MDTETKYRNALMWAFDRLSIDDMTRAEQRRTMLEIGNVLIGRPAESDRYVPNEWDESAKMTARDRPSEEAEAADAMQSYLYHEDE